MTIYSDAAKAYADSSVDDDSYSLWFTIARAFDAGFEPGAKYGAASARQPERVLTPVYPFTDGDCTVIGPECISTTPDSTPDCRLAWRGVWFSPLVPASVPAEPERLTDPDDPRWRDGAKIRGEFADGSAIEGILIRREIRWGDPDYYYLYTGNLTAIYLLAPAPDPDADKRQALVEIMTGIGVHDLTTDEADQVIICLRERGVTL